ncbi:MAG: hypothetical protein IPJ31_06925 [Bacteroidetes bacterium]|nr:hypothetical protein [Bacteroidota bacterium]
MSNPEDIKPSILFQILDLIIKDGFELEHADLERMDVLYKHFVKEPNKESIQNL